MAVQYRMNYFVSIPFPNTFYFLNFKGYVDRVVKVLKDQGFEVDIFVDTHADPDMECIRKGVEACNRFKPDLMICLGGGSPMDAGKFIRALYEHPELTLEKAASRFIELRKRTVSFPKLGSKIRRLVAIPTTSGTGSEVSPFTVITDDDGRKFPIASYKLTPDIAICDSTLCDTLPKSLIANSGIDAITHAIEAYVSVAQNDFTKMHAIEALKLLFGNLGESYTKGTPISRDSVHRGATLAGIAFSNSFLGICHSLAHKVGAEFHIPHGLTNAILLPHVIRYNSCTKPTRMGIYPGYDYPQSHKRYSDIAESIGAPTHDPEGLIWKIKELMRELDMPQSFKDANIKKEDFMHKLDQIAEDAFDDQCTPANPRFPMIPELKEILIQAYFGDDEIKPTVDTF
jgi:Alcohol dehydrogenase, class IV